MSQPKLSALGEDSLVVRLPGLPSLEVSLQLETLASQLQRQLGVCGCWAGLSELAVRYRSARQRDKALSGLSASLSSESKLTTVSTPRAAPREHTLTACLNGPDLDWVCGQLDWEAAAFADRLEASLFDVLAIGFQPGFAYLQARDPELRLQLPRRGTPRPRVPANSLAFAAGLAAVYPSASPGGWHLLGVVDESVVGNNADTRRLCRFRVGDAVRFKLRHAS